MEMWAISSGRVLVHNSGQGQLVWPSSESCGPLKKILLTSLLT